MEKNLRVALRPLIEKGATKDELLQLIWASAQSLRQGASIDWKLDQILDEEITQLGP